MRVFRVSNETVNEVVYVVTEYDFYDCITDLFSTLDAYMHFMDIHNWADDDAIFVDYIVDVDEIYRES